MSRARKAAETGASPGRRMVLPIVVVGILLTGGYLVRNRFSPGSGDAAPAPAAPLPDTQAPPLTGDGPPGPVASPTRAELTREAIAALDPAVDGWDTETFHERASRQLAALAALLAEDARPSPGDLAAFVSADSSCGALVPAGGESRASDGPTLTVEGTASTGLPETAPLRGPAGFSTALAALLAPLGDTSDRRVELKEYRIERQGSAVQSTVRFQARGTAAGRSVQVTQTWTCGWSWPDPESDPILSSLFATGHEVARATGRTGTLLSDCTEALFGEDRGLAERTLSGTAEWWGRSEAVAGVSHYGNESFALGDVNGDELEDLYLCRPGGLPNQLLLHQPDGTVREATEGSGADWLDHSEAALLVDLDGDGDQDLAVSSALALLLHENDGTGHFRLARAMEFSPSPGTLSAADFDGDGDLDLHVCRYSQGTSASDLTNYYPFPYHDANNGVPNVLLRNDGGFEFTDVTVASGLDENNRRFSFAASWEDFDNDGDPDLYVANDFGRNNLYRNDGGRFTDVAAQAGVEDISAGMSASWSDVDLDGRMDLHVGNMFSAAGNRITYQRQFQPGIDETTRAELQRHARGNSLFLNAGDGNFRDTSLEAGVTMGRWAWSSVFGDLDRDGLEDLVVANGFVTNELTKDL